jgi:hypothetical protein
MMFKVTIEELDKEKDGDGNEIYINERIVYYQEFNWFDLAKFIRSLNGGY